MKDLTQREAVVAVLKGALMGLAIGGLTSAVVDMSAKTAWGMTKATIEWAAEDYKDDDDDDEA